MKIRPNLIVLAVLAAASTAQAQILDRPIPTPRPPSTPTPSQPLVAPVVPSRPEQPLLIPAPAANPAAAPAAPTLQDTGRTVRLEQQQAHPSGVAMTLSSITYRADSIIVSASISNLSDRAMSLNRGGSLVLMDDRGRSHPFVPPADNPEVQIGARSRVTASFVFAGPLTDNARTVQLSTNGPSGSRNDRLTSVPAFLFRVPVS
ncbi:MAG: hypothetical protein JF625_17545 [Inquilinus limosus]|uniref:DUF4352 domain-containing protein n=1 Tax=Inquilinus limosus TaxID=171674 RepID=A0A952KIM9_9PROT|nr:hypothetical protein [Inquilinus limosus]